MIVLPVVYSWGSGTKTALAANPGLNTPLQSLSLDLSSAVLRYLVRANLET